MATVAAGFVRFTSYLFPAITIPLLVLPLGHDEFTFTWAQPFAAAIVLAVTAVNCLSVRVGGGFQLLLGSVKVGAIVLIIIAGTLLAAALRSMARRAPGQWVGSASPQGFAPLRQQLQLHLVGFDIAAEPEQIVLTTGITHGLTLVLGTLVRPGETVLVGDPSWFAGFGAIAAHGARPVGYPYTAEGPDIAAIERLVRRHKPKLLVINSIGHNPTGTSLRSDAAMKLLELAGTHDFKILEDDVYADLCPKDSGVRLASLDRNGRVIYAGSFTKTLAENLRVGFVACSHGMAQAIANRKVLTGFTTPESNERILHDILVSGRYRKHVERLCAKLEAARAATSRDLARLKLDGSCENPTGLFTWVDLGQDGVGFTARAAKRSLILAPGALFSPLQAPSTHMRINVTRWTLEVARFFAANF